MRVGTFQIAISVRVTVPFAMWGRICKIFGVNENRICKTVAVSYLWAWYFIALRWEHQRTLKERDKDALEKRLAAALDKYMDRWLVCSQWAGVWASSTATSTSKYAFGLAACAKGLAEKPDVMSATAALASQIEADLKEIEQSAITFLSSMNADNRPQVRTYYTALWLWNRLDKTRWDSAKVGLREKSRRKTSIEVDHIVACDLWDNKLAALPAMPPWIGAEEQGLQVDDLRPRVNELGNCMLLEKNFNISKSNSTLKSFLAEVHDFKDHKLELADWAAALNLDMAQVDCDLPLRINCWSYLVLGHKRFAAILKGLFGVRAVE
jgi:5-methylcytosine-specific restriction endonuclease McrA